MLGNVPYSFNTIDKINSAFGWIFSDVHLLRTSSDGSQTKLIKVPIDFAEKEKWDVRRREDPNAGDEPNQRHVAIILPRMSYELKDLRYDPKRKLSSVNYRVDPITPSSNPVTSVKKQLNPVPMIFSYTLYLQTSTLSDGWAVIEQVIPFFQPDYVVPIMDIPEMNIRRNIVFSMTGNSFSDSYQGSMLDKRILEWQFNFEARGHLYQPIKIKPVIKTATVDIAGRTVTSYISPGSANINEPFVIISSPEAFNYYIDPVDGDDGNSGTSPGAPWKTVERSNSVTLTGDQKIGYFFNGHWVLYRELGMTVDLSLLDANVVDTHSSDF